jgi:hypothetical protein
MSHSMLGAEEGGRWRAGILGGVKLPLAWSLVLVVTALWNLLIWPRFLQRITRDPRARDASGRATTFLRVHVVLIGVSLLLAVAVGVLGVLTLA